jgi:hypothetical protein
MFLMKSGSSLIVRPEAAFSRAATAAALALVAKFRKYVSTPRARLFELALA